MAPQADDYAAKTDPRIKRTREHVIRVAQEMLEEATEPLTFTAVADRAFVARQTLYKHWGTIENLIAETVELDPARSASYDGDVTARASTFLQQVIAQLSSAGTGAAVAAIISASHYDETSKAAAEKISSSLHASFTELVGKVDDDGFLQIVGPVLYLGLTAASTSPALIGSLASRAVDLVS
jgi:AcrR family transcriptional regulator